MANLKMLAPVAAVVLVASVILLLSFDTLEYQEMGLNYGWVTETVEQKTYTAGRYYLGLGNHFIKFPQMVKSVYFVDDPTGGADLEASIKNLAEEIAAANAEVTETQIQMKKSSEVRAEESKDFGVIIADARATQDILGKAVAKLNEFYARKAAMLQIAAHKEGPALHSRTNDGLTVRLEVSFQYKLNPKDLYQLYANLGPTYERTLVRIAIEQLTTASTLHNANDFFSNRTTISLEMHKLLRDHFNKHAYSDVPFFQLRTVHLPDEFENAIQETQVKQQEIQIAMAEQSQNRVSYETRFLQAKQGVLVLQNQAEAEAASILASNDAYNRQYSITQGLQSEALKRLKASAGWNSEQLLEYLRIRAVRDHPSERTMVKI